MLSQESCEACRADAPKVSSEEIPELMAELADWEVRQVDGVERLSKVYRFKNFVNALDFANKVGELAERADHHPRIVVEWGRVELEWWTHKIDGLHRNDFILAARSDELLPQ